MKVPLCQSFHLKSQDLNRPPHRSVMNNLLDFHHERRGEGHNQPGIEHHISIERARRRKTKQVRTLERRYLSGCRQWCRSSPGNTQRLKTLRWS